MNISANIFSKIPLNQTQEHIKRIINHDPWDLSQGCKNFSIQTNQFDIPHNQIEELKII